MPDLRFCKGFSLKTPNPENTKPCKQPILFTGFNDVYALAHQPFFL